MAEDIKTDKAQENAGESQSQAGKQEGEEGDKGIADTPHSGVEKPVKTEKTQENAGEPQRQAGKQEGEGGDKGTGTPHSDAEMPVIRSPFWPKWKCLQHYHVPLSEAVLLSCDMDPESYEEYFQDATTPEDRDGFENADLRMEIATRVSGEAFAVVRVPERNGRETIMVRLSAFAKWAKDMKQQSEEVWGTQPKGFEELASEPIPTWPWGLYTNTKLNALADAVRKFWTDYSEKAPRPVEHRIEDVREYLTKVRKPAVVPAVAEAIDYVIRPDKWGSGSVKGVAFPRGGSKSKK